MVTVRMRRLWCLRTRSVKFFAVASTAVTRPSYLRERTVLPGFVVVPVVSVVPVVESSG
jgi:hypothetical protein